MKNLPCTVCFLALIFLINCDNNASKKNHQEIWLLDEESPISSDIFGKSDVVRKDYLRNKTDDFYIEEFRLRCPEFNHINMKEMLLSMRIMFKLSLLELFIDKNCNESCVQNCTAPPPMHKVLIYIRFPLFEDRWFLLPSFSLNKNSGQIPDEYKFTGHDSNVSFNLKRENFDKSIFFEISEYSCPEKDLIEDDEFIEKFRNLDIVVEDPSSKTFWIYPSIYFNDEDLKKINNTWRISKNDYDILGSVHTKNLNYCNGSVKIIRQ